MSDNERRDRTARVVLAVLLGALCLGEAANRVAGYFAGLGRAPVPARQPDSTRTEPAAPQTQFQVLRAC